MIGNLIIYRNKITKIEVDRLYDTFATLEQAMELYSYGYNRRKDDPKYKHLPTPEDIEAVFYSNQ